MTDLQKRILDALDQLGTMTEHELQIACLIEPKQRGGFRSTLNKLFASKLVSGPRIACNVSGSFVSQIAVTQEGVWAIEADNIAKQDKAA